MRVLGALLIFAACLSLASGEWMVCYFSSWAVYRPGNGMFDVEDLDPNLCTHAVFGFAGLSNQTWTIEVLDPWNENCPDDDPEGNNCAYDRFVALKEQNPALKVILAVGGWNEGSEDYSNMVADPAKRKTFIDSSIALVEKEGFDGLDIDWEYPTQRGGVPADKENFILLLDEFRVEFDQRGLIMTAALASGKPTIDPSYDVAGIVRNIDVMSIMTYDFHGAWENFTHHNAPLCSYPSDEGDFVWFNVVAAIDYWISLGAPPEKMVMGIPLYGRCFTLDDYNNNGMLADASEPGLPGPYTRLPGTQGWNEICERIKDTSDCTVVHDPLLHEPYMYCKSDNLWCGYDDAASVTLKAQFLKYRGLAGAMVWTVDTDDFMPTCGTTKFELITTVKNVINAAVAVDPVPCTVPTTTSTTSTTTTSTTTTSTTTTPTTTTTSTTTTPTTTSTTTTPTTTSTTTTPTTTTTSTTTTPTTTSTTTTPTTTTAPRTTTTPSGPTFPNRPDCALDPDQDFYPSDDCNKYWWCVDGEAQLFLCSPGTYFNPATNSCDFPYNVDTSNCREWICVADGDQFAGADCNEYYECEHGEPIQRHCADGLYYNPDLQLCVNKGDMSTESCNPV